MFRVATTELRSGMRLGKRILASDGRVLLHEGTVLKEGYISTLQRLGIPSVYVANDLAPDVEPADIVSDKARQALTTGMKEAMADISRTFEKSKKTGRRRFSLGFDSTKVKAAVDMVVQDLLNNPRAVVNLQDIRTADEYTLGHCVNVCILSTLLGFSMGYNLSQINELGLGALMHDIGKIVIPQEILNKPDRLTPEEFEIIKQHPLTGWEILAKQPEISYLSSAVALQHHERWVGGGYPRNLRGKDIHEYARICAVVDCYDAMVADRTYRKGFTPRRALRTMTELTPDYFDPDVLRLFHECVAVYPVGALVEISGGYTAVVLAVERGKGERPVLRIVKDPSGAALPKRVDVDLSVHTEIAILQMLQESSAEFEVETIT